MKIDDGTGDGKKKEYSINSHDHSESHRDEALDGVVKVESGCGGEDGMESSHGLWIREESHHPQYDDYS